MRKPVFHKRFAFGNVAFALVRYPWVLVLDASGHPQFPRRPDFWPALGMIGFLIPKRGFRSFQVRFLWFSVAFRFPYPVTGSWCMRALPSSVRRATPCEECRTNKKKEG